MKTVYPIGTTLYRPELCDSGYTLISGAGGVKLMDMNGLAAHEWPFDPAEPKGYIHRCRLLPDGCLLMLVGPRGDSACHVEMLDWEGKLLWSHTPADGEPHHDVWPTGDGGIILACKTTVPPEVCERITDPARRGLTIYGDTIVEIARDGRVVWRWAQHEHLDINLCNPIPADRSWGGGPDNNTVTDWTHTNSVQALPANRWHDAGDERFRPGNVLMSMRQLDTIAIADRVTGEVAWSYTGGFRGGLSGQHEAHMIEPDLPGAGNILVFDNGSSPRDLAHAAQSYVLEIEPPSGKVVWHYEDGSRFFSPFTSNCQRLAGGNTLIHEAAGWRLFEVTPAGEIVWEHVITDNAKRVHRYPYDFCPQSAALPRPAERPVTPPETLTIPPDDER